MDNVVNITNDVRLLMSEKYEQFTKLMTQYECAMLEVKTKLDVLNAEMSLETDRNPFKSINCRLKKPASIADKLRRYGVEISVDSIEKNLHDVAGVRVICPFVDDIYTLSDKLCSHDDIKVLVTKDYIKNPKPNGYRSLHLIIEVPVFLSQEKKYMQVEVQFRTIAMDCWASLEHKMKYKKDISNADEVMKQLKECADEMAEVDLKMQQVRKNIDKISINQEAKVNAKLKKQMDASLLFQMLNA